jgi:hypothetical protein
LNSIVIFHNITNLPKFLSKGEGFSPIPPKAVSVQGVPAITL